MFVLRNFHTTPIEEVKHLFPAHLEWIEQRVASGHFLFAGPQDPRVGGLILARASSVEDVWSIIAEDPFGSAVTYDVTQVYPTHYAAELEQLLAAPEEGDTHEWRSRPAPFQAASR